MNNKDNTFLMARVKTCSKCGIEKPLTVEQQRQKYNFDEKHKALDADLDTFTGKCLKHGESLFKVYKSNQKHHCIECKAEIFKRKKELAA